MSRYTTTGTKNSLAALNAELEKVAESQKELLSREGEAPNSMNATLDMNGNKIINVVTDLDDPNSLVSRKDVYSRQEVDAKDEEILSKAKASAISFEGSEASTSLFPLSSITQLKNADPVAFNGTVFVESYFEDLNKGGGFFTWDATNTTEEDGGIYIASNIQSTGRWVRKVEDSITPEMFGARGDGVTDDAEVFSRIKTFAPTLPLKLLGFYVVSQSVNHLLIEGSGAESSGFIRETSSSIQVLSYTNETGVVLKNFSIDGKRLTGELGSHGIRLDNCDGVIVENVVISDTDGYGIGLQGVGTHKNYTFRNIQITRTSIDGFDIKNRSFNNENIVLDNVYVTDAGMVNENQAAIDIRGPVKVINCHVRFTEVAGTLLSQPNTDGIRPRASSAEQFGAEGAIIENCKIVASGAANPRPRFGVASECGEITVKNTVVENMSTGILLYGDSVSTRPNINSLVEGVTTKNCVNGIADFAIASKIIGCSLEGSSEAGINLQDAVKPTIIACRAFDGEIGFNETSSVDSPRYTNCIAENNIRNTSDRKNNSIPQGQIVGNSYLFSTSVSQEGEFEQLANVDRPPSRKDSYQYSNAAIWQHKGRLWTPSRTALGSRTSWTRQPEVVSSVFNSIGSCIGAYYTFKVNPDYTGPCIRVRNEGNGGESDIGFDENGYLDAVALRRSLGGQRGTIARWYDQSGLGNNVTPTSPANAPIISSYTNKRGIIPVIFETSVVNGGETALEQSLQFNSGTFQVNAGAVSISILTGVYNSYFTVPMVGVGAGNQDAAVGMSSQNGVNSVLLRQQGSVRVISNFVPNIDQNLITAAFGTSSVEAYFNDEEGRNATGTAVPGLLDAFGGKIGGGITGFADGEGAQIFGGAIIEGFSIFNKQVSLLEHRNLFRAFSINFDFKPQSRRNVVVFDGDSIVEGDSAREFMSWPRATMDMSNIDYRGYIVARGGAGISDQLLTQPTWLNKIYDSTMAKNLIVLSIGTNDLGAGRTANDVYTDVQTYIDNAKAVGYDVVITTILPRSSFIGNSKETERLAYNELIRNNFSDIGCVGLIDWDLEGTMGDVNNVGTNVYYDDGTHPTTYGYSLLASYAELRLEEIFKEIL